MSGLLERCVEYFNTDSLYDVLGVEKEGTKSDLKKGYHRKSLAHHPDRASPEDKTAATQRFQVLAQVHSILSDDGRRAEYDETGYVDEEMTTDGDKDWDAYWRLLFPKITAQDIQDFADKYKGSDEELSDLKKAYVVCEGDLSRIMEQMMCCDLQDEPRFTQILRDLIECEELPDFDAFSKESDKKKKTRAKKASREAKEAAEEAKKMKLGDSDGDLMALIAQRQASRGQQADNFFAQLEAKYGGGEGGGGKKKGGAKAKNGKR